MSMIEIHELTFGYEGSCENVFERISFRIDTDWRLGLIGRNGRGKTTLLRLLQGKYEYSGSITAGVEFDCFPFEVEDCAFSALEVAQSVCPTAQSWQLLRELNRLGVCEDALWRPYETLSKGEQTKVLLAALFLREGRYLLIDEPTNHLDLAGRRQVAQYLKSKKGFLLVSHDRDFLDACVDHIVSINREGIQVQSGNFSDWYRDKLDRDKLERAQNERLKAEIVRLKTSAQRASDWADRVERSKIGEGPCDRGYIGHKSAAMMKRSKAIERRREAAAEEKSKLLRNVEYAAPLKLTPLSFHSACLAEFADVSLSYGDRTVLNNLRLRVERGQRILLNGPNGCGKSTVLRLLGGAKLPIAGRLTRAGGLTVSVVPQDASFLRGNLSDYAGRRGIDESLFKTILRKLDFSRAQFDRDMSELSAGQRKKVLIAASLCERAHLYLWDEPLNYIDIFSRIQIEELLLSAPDLTLVFAEHDAAFARRIATETADLGTPL